MRLCHPLTPGLLLATLCAAAFVLACQLTLSGVVTDASRGDDVLENLLGGGRMFVGGLAMNRADLYLHRGLSGTDATTFTNRWFQRLGAMVSPTSLDHREGKEGMQEVLPWITLAARAAPTNTDYVLTQSFLFRVTGDLPRALQEICRVRATQPDNPEIRLEEARIRLALDQWRQAAAALDACARLLGSPPSERQSPLLAEACMWRGLLFERSGDSKAAAMFLESAAQLEPGMYGLLAGRASTLRAGRPPPVPVAEVLAQYRRIATNPLCTHSHGHDHGEHDDDD
jgi:tetratricopeptide (TPR) repeat protein